MYKVFGGKTCEKVAQNLEGTLQNYLVFSICSDERLPPNLEEYIKANNIPKHLIIVGDFISSRPSQAESPASYEAIRLIQNSSNFEGALEVSWLNGVSVNSANLFQQIKWNLFDSSQCRYGRNKDSLLVNYSKFLIGEDKLAYDNLCKLLKFDVYITVDNNKVISIDLTDNQLYPRGIAIGLSIEQQQKVWGIILKLQYLKKLKASFNQLRFIPDFTSLCLLEELDVRGNPDIDLTNLHTAKSLKKLNISACALKSMPSSIETLSNLTSLLAYKNFISDISNVKFPVYLNRLSLYRNLIDIPVFDLSYCDELQEINLGANPISKMLLKTSSKLRMLKLRVRHLEDSISVSHQGNTKINIIDE